MTLTMSVPVPKNNVVFTPPNYASRLSHLLSLKGYNPIWCPTVLVHPTPPALLVSYPTSLLLISKLSPPSPSPHEPQSSPLSAAAADLKEPLLSPQGDTFVIAALGKDAELIDDDLVAKFCENPKRIKLLVPPTATPSGLVESLGGGGGGNGRTVLCPVPLMVDLEEPPVVPNFLRDLEAKGWVAVIVSAYETRWTGPECAREVVERCERRELYAVVFTSTAVEGLLKSLRELGWRDFKELVRERCPELVVAAHGPVTAAGAQRLGVKVDVVSSRFDSFEGVVDALGLR